jgi:hypothetical protein
MVKLTSAKSFSLRQLFFNESYRNRFFLLILLIFPFIYLFPYILPLRVGDFDVAVGNDFRALYFSYKVYLLHFFSKFQIPLWSPSEACGYPLYSNPFSQFFYPLNIILVIYYKIVGYYSSVAHHRFTVFGISILSIGIYNWLKSIKINNLPAFMTALLTSVSVGSLEMLRFPNAVHTLCWFPWVLFAISKIFSSEKKKDYIKYSLFLIFFLISAITAGYPYYMFYSIFLFVPYFIFYLFRGQRLKLFGNDKKNITAAVIIIIFSVIIVGIISYPYIKNVIEITNQTTNRGGNDYEFSTDASELPIYTLGSLIFPPIADISNCFYFGLLNLFIIILYFLRTKQSETGDNKKWVILIWIALLIYITYGSKSYLFDFFWNYFPFFSKLREWGKLNKIVFLLIAWLLGYAFSNFINIIEQKEILPKNKKIILFGLSISVLIFITISAIYKFASEQWDLYFIKSKIFMLNIYQPSVAAKVSYFLLNFNYVFAFFSLVLCVLIFLFIKYNFYGNKNIKRKIIFIIILFSLVESFTFAPWLWTKAEKHRIYGPLEIDNRKAFETQRTFLYKTVSLDNTYNAGLVSVWYYKSYVDFCEKYKDDSLNLKRILGISNKDKLFFTTDINHPDLKSFFIDVDSNHPIITVKDYTGNSLDVDIDVNYDGYLNFIDNADSKWFATVNGKNTNIEKLFGTFKSVFISKGMNNVKFTFKF